MKRIIVHLKNGKTKTHTVDLMATDRHIYEFLNEKYGYYSWEKYEFI